MDNFGRILFVVGISIAGVGALLWLLSATPFGARLGRLPGDFAYQRDGMSFFFPLTTMILLSAAVSGVLWLLGMIRR